jgi:hypothetical protein
MTMLLFSMFVGMAFLLEPCRQSKHWAKFSGVLNVF